MTYALLICMYSMGDQIYPMEARLILKNPNPKITE